MSHPAVASVARVVLVVFAFTFLPASLFAQPGDNSSDETAAPVVLIDVVVNLAKVVEFENTSADEIESRFGATDFDDLDELTEMLPNNEAVELHHSLKFTAVAGRATRIESGQQIPVITGASANRAGGMVYSVSTMAAGLKFNVTPDVVGEMIHVDVDLDGVFLRQMEKLEGDSFAHTQANTLNCSTVAACQPGGTPAVIRLEQNGELWMLVVAARLR